MSRATPSLAAPTVTDVFRRQLAERQSTATHEPSWLHELRQRGMDRFYAVGFPTTKLEAWRQTNVGPWVKPFDTAAQSASSTTAGPRPGRDKTGVVLKSASPFSSLPGLRFVFVNGRLSERSAHHDSIGSLADALAIPPRGTPPQTGETGVLVQHTLGHLATPDLTPFAALNTALWTDGVLAVVPPAAKFSAPLIIEHIATEAAGGLTVPRHVVIVGDHAEFTLLEVYASAVPQDAAAEPSVTAPVTEIVLGRGAKVEHIRVTLAGLSEAHLGATAVRLNAESRYVSHVFHLSGPLTRHDLRIGLNGELADAKLLGLSITDDKRHVDNHTWIDHAKPNASSDELYKGILAGRSSTVFSGRIHVHPHAVKTNAYQNNRHLLLSESAVVNTMPQLEIYADDVKCTHGATVGTLDDEQLFYLRSRGLNAAAARELLTYAFARDTVERIELAAARPVVESAIQARLKQLSKSGDTP